MGQHKLAYFFLDLSKNLCIFVPNYNNEYMDPLKEIRKWRFRYQIKKAFYMLIGYSDAHMCEIYDKKHQKKYKIYYGLYLTKSMLKSNRKVGLNNISTLYQMLQIFNRIIKDYNAEGVIRTYLTPKTFKYDALEHHKISGKEDVNQINPFTFLQKKFLSNLYNFEYEWNWVTLNQKGYKQLYKYKVDYILIYKLTIIWKVLLKSLTNKV